MSQAKFWCGVVSRDHIKRGEQGGFCQVCHGKKAPLARMRTGDGIVFYSPTLTFQGNEKCQRFTAIGKVSGDDTYKFQMTEDFKPYRRDITYFPCQDIAIQPLLHDLSFTKGKKSWGYLFRFGHFEITQSDFRLLAFQMLGENYEGVFKFQPPPPEQLSLFSYPDEG